MPGIPKGAKLTEQQKKKLQKMAKDGASKSEVARVRMGLLRGHTFAKAKKAAMDVKRDEKRAVKKAVGKKNNARTTKDEVVAEDYTEQDM